MHNYSNNCNKDQLHKEQFQMLLDNVTTSVVVHIVISSTLLYLLWPEIHHTTAILWFLTLMLFTLLRYVLLFLHKRNSSLLTINQWHHFFIIVSSGSAMIWGAGSWLIFPENSTEHQFVLLLFFAGLSAGSMVTLAASRRVFIPFLLLLIIPISLRFFSINSEISQTLSYITLFYMIILLISTHRINNNLMENLELRLQSDIREKQLQQEYSKSQQYLDIAGVMIVALDANGDVILMNQKGCEILGYEQGEILNKNWFDTFIPEKNREKIKKTFHKIIDKHIHIRNDYENEVITKCGEKRLISWHNRLIRRNDRIIGTLSSGEDITEQKIAEQELILARTEAEKSSIAKGQFLATMSHEIRTPMNGVLGVAQLLSETNLNDEQKDFVETILNSGQTLLAIINDILDFSKIDAGEMKLDPIDFNLKKTIQEIINLLKSQASAKNIDLFVNISSDCPAYCHADNNRLRQVLFNLIGNAIKFTEAGHVHIKVKVQEQNATMSHLLFEIEDTGIGIAPEVQKKLFTPFTQADASTTRTHGGTGLGLSISKRIIELMGGEISLKSILEKGSTFSFVLALPISKSEKQSVDPEFITADSVSNAHILLVEDNLINQKIAVAMLKRLNHQISIANNGQEAIDQYKQHSFDIILMDCQMPIMDGYEATKIIRQMENNTSHTPIIALTANAMHSDRQICIDAGMDDFISKPVKKEILTHIISKQLRKVN